jgi:hypothetical protein
MAGCAPECPSPLMDRARLTGGVPYPSPSPSITDGGVCVLSQGVMVGVFRYRCAAPLEVPLEVVLGSGLCRGMTTAIAGSSAIWCGHTRWMRRW